MLLGTEYDNLWYGIDIRRLVAEGLLDQINIYPYDFGARKGGYDPKFFHEVCAPKSIPFRMSISGDVKTVLTQALSYYDGGADGIAVFDASTPDTVLWTTVSRFGHIAEMHERVKGEIPASKYTFFHRLGNNIMNGRFYPVWGG